MNEFDSYIGRIIKQIYKVLAYEFEMGLTENNSSNIYFLQFLKRLQGQSLDNIRKIIRQAGLGSTDGNKQITVTDTKMLLEFFTRINNMKSVTSRDWLYFQHCMNFTYRNFTSSNPITKREILSRPFLGDMKKIAKKLIQTDEGQFYLRVFSLLREYTMFSYWVYRTDENKNTPKISRLLQHYKSYINACDSLRYVFLDFEKVLLHECNMTWYDFNTFIFFNYFYEVINEEILLKHKDMSEIESSDPYAKIKYDFLEINLLWRLIRKSYEIYKEYFNKNLMDHHTTILSKNFWIARSNKGLRNHDIKRIITELLLIPCQRLARESEPILSKTGQCLCEDCLIIKLNFADDEHVKASTSRISSCRYCSDVIELNDFYKHISVHLAEIDIRKMIQDNVVSKPTEDFIDDRKVVKAVMEKSKVNDKIAPLRVEINNSISLNIPKDYLLKIWRKYDTMSKELKERNLYLDGQTMLAQIENQSPEVVITPSKIEQQLTKLRKPDENKTHAKCTHNGRGRQCECNLCETKPSDTRARLRIGLSKRKENLIAKNVLTEKIKNQTEDKSKPARCLGRCDTNLKVNDVKTRLEQKPREPLPHKLEFTNSALKSNVPLKKKHESVKNKKKMENEEPRPPKDDIRGLVNFIEGNDPKTVAAQKKAAKRMRQRLKREEERKKQEEEEKRLLKQKQDREENRLKMKKEKELLKEVENQKLKKKKDKQKVVIHEVPKSQVIEEILDGVITVKKPLTGDMKSVLTVTLKASTEQHDKLFNSLIESHVKENKGKKKNKPSNNTEQKLEQQVKLKVIKNGSNKDQEGGNKVKLSFLTNHQNNIDINVTKEKPLNTEENVNIPFIKLPPGITITKVDGPISNKSYKILEELGDEVSQDNKKGVIVVETEKLMKKNNNSKKKQGHKNQTTNQSKRDSKTKGKKNENTQHRVVTLKNPMFNPTLPKNPALEIAVNSCDQASIFQNENGMVTIRSQRLQQSLDNRLPLQNLVTDLKPIIGGDITSPKNVEPTLSSMNAQEILSGLPGIEITKVEKGKTKSESVEHDVAQVSIIPSSSNPIIWASEDDDDFLYDNVFKPKDVCFDDLDEAERDVELFKRFVQNSIPPKCKEKVNISMNELFSNRKFFSN